MKKEYKHYAFAVINFKNLLHNLAIIKRLIPSETEIMIPVKCNAYGLGIIEISKFLIKNGIRFLSVAFPFEAFILREHNIGSRILVFNEPLSIEDIKKMIELNITPTIFTEDSLTKFNKYAKRIGKRIKIHINIDTGMGRIGVPYKKSIEFIKNAAALSNIEIEGIYSHFPAADEKDKRFTRKQIKIFDSIINSLKNHKISPRFVHISNSAGIINYPSLKYNMVRPGIMFYGYFPDNNIKKQIRLKQGLSLKSYITFIKKTEKQTPISYGHTYYTRKDEIIATIGCGYGDGINRLLSNNGYVLINGRKCKIRGRICMDQFMVDATNLKNISIGDIVTIFGEDKDKEIRLEEIAKKLDTIPYELLCNIGNRVKRVYV